LQEENYHAWLHRYNIVALKIMKAVYSLTFFPFSHATTLNCQERQVKRLFNFD
jgi:hypothetical protein